MKTLMTICLASLPLLADAQTANTPGGSASTGTPLEQAQTTPSTSDTTRISRSTAKSVGSNVTNKQAESNSATSDHPLFKPSGRPSQVMPAESNSATADHNGSAAPR